MHTPHNPGFTPDNVFGLDALHRAWGRVQFNRGAHGVDGVDILSFGRRIDHELHRLHDALSSGSYAPAPLRRVTVQRAGHKDRELCIPTVADRIVQTAAARHIGTWAETQFLDASHGYRMGRGVATAVAGAEGLVRRGATWALDADIANFFQSVRLDLLGRALGGWIHDPQVASVVQQFLQGLSRLDLGLPLGSPLSPLLANISLHAVDLKLAHNGLRNVRYADDMLVLADSEAEARRGHRVLADALAEQGLRLNDVKTRLVQIDKEELPFLGQVLDFRHVSAKPISPMGEARRSEPPAAQQQVAEAGPQHGYEPDPRHEAAPDATLPTDIDLVDAAPVAAGAAAGAGWSEPRTLYVVRQGARLHRDGERLVVRAGQDVLASLPIRQIDLIMVMGNVGMTSGAIRLALEHGVKLSILDRGGRYIGALSDDGGRKLGLLQAQMAAAADPSRALELARGFVTGKLANAIAVGQRIARSHGRLDAVGDILRSSRQILEQARRAQSLDVLRGLEGFGARQHYACMRVLLGPQWSFDSRQRHPAPDPVNAMLDLGSAMLARNVEASLHAHGLNPWMGFLHKPRAGHAALASDLIEEFRAPVVDSLVIHLCVNGRLLRHDFETSVDNACRLSESALKRFINAFEARMGSADIDGRTVGYRRVIDEQVRQLADVLQGTQARYRPVRVR